MRGSGFVRTKPEAKWPAQLEVKLPPESASSPVAEAPAPAPAAQPTAASGFSARHAGADFAYACSHFLARFRCDRRRRRPRPLSSPRTPTPIAQAPMAAPAPAPATEAPAPAAVAEAPAPAAAAEAPTSASAEPESPPEFAPDSIKQLIGAWATSEADCSRTLPTTRQSVGVQAARWISLRKPRSSSRSGSGCLQRFARSRARPTKAARSNWTPNVRTPSATRHGQSTSNSDPIRRCSTARPAIRCSALPL